MIRKTPFVTLLVLTLAGFLICIFLALISIPLHKYGGFPDYTGFILMLSLFAIIGLANSIHPPKIGTPRKYSNRVWVHRALAKTPLWLQLILVFYWIIVFILIPV